PFDWVPNDVELTTPQSAKLLPYQIAAVLRLKRALTHGNALDASDTGSGKTYCALVAAAELGLRPCIIAPLAVLPSWQRAAAALGVTICWLINYDKIRGGKGPIAKWEGDGKSKTFVFKYLPENHILIFDEVQKCKSPDSLQGKMLRDAARAGHKILCLSATAAKDPTEMRNLGTALKLHDGTRSNWEQWCVRNGCTSGQYGLKFAPFGKGKRYLEAIHRAIFPQKGNRIRVADLPEFPETRIEAETLDTGNTDFITGAYAEMDKELAKIQSDTGMTANDKGASTLAAMMKARIASEKGKLKLFRELAEEAIEEGRSAVIFLNFREHIDILMKDLKTKCVVWGGQKADERQQCIDDFQADRSRIIIISLQAGGAGLSLHDLNGNFPRLAIISPSYSAIDLKQALGRVHRAGAKTKSFQRIIFAAGTIEEQICESVREKLSNIDTLNDGTLAPESFLKLAA
ncbi:MAG: helicase-related protein, partial [Undibacterium sp.]